VGEGLSRGETVKVALFCGGVERGRVVCACLYGPIVNFKGGTKLAFDSLHLLDLY
jgi:hypothetical protein